MNRQLYHILALLPLLAALASCSWNESLHDPFQSPSPSDKTPIELSVGGVDAPAQTRAVITDGTNKTLNPFTTATRLFLYMKSEDANTDNAHTHTATKYALTYAEAAAAASGKSPVTTAATQQLYWDDAHSRCSKLTVYAFAIANKQRGSMQIDKTSIIKFGPESGAQPKVDFRTDAINPTFDWAIGGGYDFCSQEIFDWGDVVFSNNIANNTTYSKPDGRMDFDWNTSSPTYRKFDKGDLIFYHALSKVTFHVVMGEGFTESDFKFNTGTNIKLQGFNGSGTFDLAQGEFTSTTAKTLNYIAPQNPSLKTDADVPSKKYYEVYSYLVPGTNLKNSTETEALTLYVNNNKYVVPMKTLYDKILENTENQQNASTVKETVLIGGTSMKAGVNYLFTINIGKSKINNISATVADWEDVKAEEFIPSNARITLNVEDRSGSSSTSLVTSNMDIYRALDMADVVRDDYEGYNWTTGYTTDGKATWKNTTLAYNSTDSRWSTDWFWESNQHYYHIRTLSPTSQVVTEDIDKGDYTTITSASCTSEANYNQAAWGAPFADVADTYKFTYDPTSGLDGIYANASTPYHQLYQAIGPTLDQIKVLMFHMYSGVHFTIKTTSGNDKVELFDGTNRTRVDLVAYYPEGKVRLATCTVDASGTLSTIAAPYNVPFASAVNDEHYTNQEYYFSAVPQDLTNVKMHITTPDHNLYIVDLANVIVTGDPNLLHTNMGFEYTQVETNKYKIDRWCPNVKYTYTFTLKKTGITNIQATIVDWETVTADDETVQIQ